MSKRDQIKKAIELLRIEMQVRESMLAQQQVTLDALEAALQAEEEAIQYDAYVQEQEAKAESEVF